MNLNYEEVQQIVKLLDDSPYDELVLQTGSFTLQLRRSGEGKAWQQQLQVSAAATPAHTLASNSASPVSVNEPAPGEAGLLDVRAPMVGTWYRAPQPGADPFISVGSTVNPDSVIGIIEVMKLMSSIPARVSGTVAEILAEDASFVEKGQLLLRVRPA